MSGLAKGTKGSKAGNSGEELHEQVKIEARDAHGVPVALLAPGSRHDERTRLAEWLEAALPSEGGRRHASRVSRLFGSKRPIGTWPAAAASIASVATSGASASPLARFVTIIVSSV